MKVVLLYKKKAVSALSVRIRESCVEPGHLATMSIILEMESETTCVFMLWLWCLIYIFVWGYDWDAPTMPGNPQWKKNLLILSYGCSIGWKSYETTYQSRGSKAIQCYRNGARDCWFDHPHFIPVVQLHFSCGRIS